MLRALPRRAHDPLTSGTSGHDCRGPALASIGLDTALQVTVRDNNVDQALRVLKKKMQREGVFREMKQRRAYEKPSERKTREKADAVRRARKMARKQAQRDGLLPASKPRRPEAGRGGGSGRPAPRVAPASQA